MVSQFTAPTHGTRNAVYGSPTGKKIPLKTLAPFIEEASQLLKLNPNHPGLDIVRSFFKSRHEAAAAGKEFKFAGEYFLIWEKYDLHTIVTRLAGSYILYRRDWAGARRYYASERALLTNLYQCLTGHLPWKEYGYKRATLCQFKHFGKQIHEKLAIFFLGLARAADYRKAQQEARREGLGAPWELDPPRGLQSGPQENLPRSLEGGRCRA